MTHIDLQPYMFIEENMFLGDFRLHRMNDGNTGWNFGAGWRRYLADHDVILGAVGYFDYDNSRPQEFEQVGLSLEVLSRWLDVRANWYVPIGEKERILGTGFIRGSQQFQGNLLLIDTVTTFGNAAEGVDVTLTSPVPWEFLQPFNVEASAGFYHFQVRDKPLPNLWGYRMRADASFFDRMLQTFVELTHDRQHHTNVIFGASLAYYGGFESRNRIKDRQYYRMSEWVRRNYNVVTIISSVINEDVPVINPRDGESYIFAHIDNFEPPGLQDGTFENPVVDINEAFAMVTQGLDEDGELQDVDVYFVHGGSQFTGDAATLVVPAEKILLGENIPGRPQTLPAQGLGPIELPVANPGAGPVTLLNASGSAINGTDALLVGAFNIVNPSLHGLLVSGPSSLTEPQLFRDLNIFGAGTTLTMGDGIRFQSASGTYDLVRVRVAADDTFNNVPGDGANGAAFHVIGGNAVITAMDADSDVLTSPTLENSGGNVREVVLIEETLGGSVDLSGITINDHAGVAAGTGGGGIRLLNNTGSVALGEAVIDNTMIVPMIGTTQPGVGAGVEVFGGAGNTTFFGDVTITNASGVGFLVNNLLETGQVNVAASTDITVNDRNDVGARFTGIAGTVQFSPTLATGTVPASSLTIGPLSTVTNTLEPAVRFDSSTGRVSVNNVTVANSNTDGILIGVFNPLSMPVPTAEQNRVTVNPMTGARTRPLFVATGTTNINNTGSALAGVGFAGIRIEGVAIDDMANPDGEASNVDFRDTVNINTRVDRGVHIRNTSGNIQFSGVTTVNNDATIPTNRASLHIRESIGTISFNDFISNDTIPGEPAVEIRDIPLPGAVGFNNIFINNAQGDGLDQPFPFGDLDPDQADPEDVTGLFVLNVSNFTTTDGTIDVMDGIAVEIQNAFPRLGIRTDFPALSGLRVVRDNMNRRVVLDESTGTPIPIAVLDANLNPIVDANGNPVIPDIFTLTPVPGYQVVLTEVNAVATALATAQSFGIFLRNNTGTFEITGVQGVPGSGGQIIGSTPALIGPAPPNQTALSTFFTNFSGSGLFADDADQVIIRNQDYIANERGLVFFNMNENVNQGFFLEELRVQNSPQEAVRAVDVRNITIQDSDFQNNGFVDQDPDPVGELFRDTIFITVNELPDDPFEPDDDDNPQLFPYTYVIDRNTFLDQVTTSGSDGVRITTGAGFARGSLLTLFFRDNNFLTFDRDIDVNDNPHLLRVIWNGTIDALISGNIGNIINNASPRGFEITQQSTDDNNSQVVLTNNVLNFNNSPNAIGAFFDFVGTARIDATFNAFDMGNGGSTGLLFRLLGESNDVEIANNILDFGLVGPNLGSGVGVNVLQVVGGTFPSSFLINGNIIGSTIADAANTAFLFQTVIGQINLFGNVQNTVFANNFFLPLNNPNIVGQININGGFFP